MSGLLGVELTSVDKSPEVKARFMEIYDEEMTDRPVPYEDVSIDTQYCRKCKAEISVAAGTLFERTRRPFPCATGCLPFGL